MPSARRHTPSSRPVAKSRPAPPARGGRAAKKPATKRPAAPTKKPPVKASASGARSKAEGRPTSELALSLPGGRRHVLSLSFVRDGDDFLARLESDGGQITELKNRSLDQLLTLVAGELEDLLE